VLSIKYGALIMEIIRQIAGIIWGFIFRCLVVLLCGFLFIFIAVAFLLHSDDKVIVYGWIWHHWLLVSASILIARLLVGIGRWRK